MDDERTAKVIIEADTDDYQKNIKASTEQTSKLTKGLDELSKKLDGLTRRTGNKLMLFGAADIAALGAMSAIAGTLQKQMSSIEASAANINKNLRGYEKFNVNQAREDIRAISRELPVQRAEVAQTQTAIMKMGVTNTPAVSQLTDNFIRMGGATGENPIGLANAQIGLSRQMGNMSISGGQIPRYNDVATGLSTSAGVPATSTMDFAQSLSGSARAAGISQTDLMGISTAFARSGQEGMYAANTFNTIINEIARIQKTGSPAIKKYANVIGATNEQTSTMNPMDIFSKVIEQVSQSGNEGTRILEDLGLEGPRTMRAIQGVAAEGGVQKWINEARVQYAQGGAVTAGSEAAFGGFFDEMEVMKNKFTDMGQVIGESVLPVMDAFASTLNTALSLVQPLIEPLMRLGGMGAGVLGAGAMGMGLLLKHWAAASTPALASRVARSSYATIFREGMLTGGQTAQGLHADNQSLRSLQAERLGPLQRAAFRVGAGLGAFGQETYGQAGIRPLRFATNTALYGVQKTADFLGKGASEFYRDAALRPDERIKGERVPKRDRWGGIVLDDDGNPVMTNEARKRPGVFRSFWGNFAGAREHGIKQQFFGRFGNLGEGGMPDVDPVSAEGQYQSVEQGKKWQQTYERRKQDFVQKFGMLERDAEEMARQYTKPEKLTKDELKRHAKDFQTKVSGLMDMSPGMSRERAEEQIVTSQARKAQDDYLKRQSEAEESKTPMGILTGALNTLTGAVKELTAKMAQALKGAGYDVDQDRAGYGPPAGPGVDPRQQPGIGPGLRPYEKMPKPQLAIESAEGWARRMNETPIPTQAKRTVGSVLKGAGRAAVGSLSATAGGIGMAAGGLVNALGGPASVGLMAGIPAVLGLKDMWDQNQASRERTMSGAALSEDIFATWNKALENSTGKLYRLSDSIDGLIPASTTAAKAFSDTERAVKEGRNKETIDFAPIELLKDDTEALVSWAKTQKPTGADADKMASDLVKTLGPEKAVEVMKKINDPSYKVLGDQVGSLAPALTTKIGENAAATEGMSAGDRFWAGNYPGAEALDMQTFWGTQAYKNAYDNPETLQARTMEAWFSEYARTTSDVAEKFDTGEETDKTTEAYEYKTAKDTLSELIKGAGTDQGNAAVQKWLEKFSSTSQGADIEYDEAEIAAIGQGGDADQARDLANRILASTSVGKSVEGMSQEEIDATVKQMVEDPWGAGNRKYVKEIRENEFYKEQGLEKEYRGSTLSETNRYEDFAVKVAGSEKFRVALGEERESGKAQYEAVRELQNLAKEEGATANEQEALLQTIINTQGANSQAGQYAAAAQGLIQFDKDLQTSTMNSFGQTQQALKDVEEFIANNDKETTEDYDVKRTALEQTAKQDITADVMRQRQYTRGLERDAEDYSQQTKWQEADQARQVRWSKSDFTLQQERQLEDFQKSIRRSRDDFNLSMERSEEDYRIQNKRAEDEYYRSRKRSNFDFELSMTRTQEDFQRQRRRSNKDYNIAMERQLQTSTKTILNPFQRQMSADVSDPATLIQNLGEQNNIFKQLKKDIDKLKSMGMTQETIDNLGLADINNWQQTRELADSITKGDIRQINKKMGRRKQEVQELTQDGRYNRDYRWQTKDRERQLEREDKDFARSVRHQTADYRRGLRRQQDDWERSIRHRDADWERSISRQLADYRRGLRRQRHDFNIGQERQEKDFDKSMKRQEKMFDISMHRRDIQHRKSLKRMHEDFVGMGDLIGKDMEELTIEYKAWIDKFFKGETGNLTEYLNNAGNEWRTILEDLGNDVNDVLGWFNGQSAVTVTIENETTPAARNQSGNPVHGKGHAAGGITTGPLWGLFGEAGTEAIIPLTGQGISILAEAFEQAFDKVESRKRVDKSRDHPQMQWNGKPISDEQLHKMLEKSLGIKMTKEEIERMHKTKNTYRSFGQDNFALAYQRKVRDMNVAARRTSVSNRGMTPDEGKMRMSIVNHNNNFSGITVVSQDPDEMARKLKHKARMLALRSGSRKDVRV